MKERIDAQKGPRPVGPYSPAIRAHGFIFVSGQGPISPETREILRGPIQDQVCQTLENVKTILEAAGSSMEKAVKCTVYLRDIIHFQAMNEVYGTYFGGVMPARTTIQVADLPGHIDVEIDVIALE